MNAANEAPTSFAASPLARIVSSTSLMAWGILILFIEKKGLLPLLQHPRFAIITLITAWILIILSITRLFMDSSSSFSLYLTLRECFLLLPLFLFWAFPFSKDQVQSLVAREVRPAFDVSSTSDPSDEYDSWNKTDGIPEPNLLQLLLACSDPDMRHQLKGKLISLDGQYLPADKGYKITRLYMYCCAADIQTIEVFIDGTPPVSLKKGEWLRIEGYIRFSGEKERLYLVQKNAKTIPPPKNAYLYSGGS